MRYGTLFVISAMLLASPAFASGPEAPGTPAQRVLTLATGASSAEAAGEHGKAADTYEQILELLPHSMSARLAAARARTRIGDHGRALEHLDVAVELGLRFDPAEDVWDPLRGLDRFGELVSRMKAYTAPIVRSTVAFSLEKDLIPENIAHDPASGAFFAGSMYQAKIIRIAPDGAVTDFVPPRRDGLLSVLGMKVDAERRELWAAAGNFGERPPMQIEDPSSVGRGALFRFDLEDGRLIRAYWGPGGSAEDSVQFNDLVITPEGDVYATAGPNGIWRVRRNETDVEPYLSRPGAFFNGIAITPDGRTVYAASHMEGVLKIDLASGEHQIVQIPSGVTLAGIDGLYVHDDSLVGVQNGTNPVRVIRAWLDEDGDRIVRFVVLEQEHPESDLPLTGTIVGSSLYYVARSQIRAFEGRLIWPEERLKPATILELPLEIAMAPAPNLETEKQALLAVHESGNRAHLELDADLIAEGQGDEFVSATRGEISRASREETTEFFRGYFDGASYPQYEDIEPPIVRISDDASMAWILSRTRVRRVKDGQETSFVYAGMMAYEKQNGRWVRVGNASTFSPE